MYVETICKCITWTYQVKYLFARKRPAVFTWLCKLRSAESCRYDFYHTWKKTKIHLHHAAVPLWCQKLTNARTKQKALRTRWGWRALSGRRSCPARPWWGRDAGRPDSAWPSACDSGFSFQGRSWAARCESSPWRSRGCLSTLGRICLVQDVCGFCPGRTRQSPWCPGCWRSSTPALRWPAAASSCGWWLRLRYRLAANRASTRKTNTDSFTLSAYQRWYEEDKDRHFASGTTNPSKH